MQSIKRFFKQVFTVVIGIFASLALFVGILLLLLQPSKPKITDKTVLHITLRGKVVEHAPDTGMKLFKGNSEAVIDLLALKAAIKHAQGDTNIQGIYLEADVLKAGWASLEEIRKALLSFQKAGKFIVAYGERYTQKTYYLASLADEIVLHPAGIFPLRGLSQTVFFYKALLDQLEVAPQIFRVGKYKSAIEPFIRQDMSQASKHQNTVLLNGIYEHFLNKIASARALKKPLLQQMADALAVVIPCDAYQAKLVSQLGNFADAEALIKARLSIAKEAPINYVPFTKYAACKKPLQASKHQIAVLIAEGAIVDGEGGPDTIGSKDLAASLRALRENKAVKAIVLRINSPGGSALASDALWQELVLTKTQKPVIASMSNVAASGGYYLAAACNRILAHPTTITGSIGIFGLFFDANALLRNKLGITTDAVKTGNSADLFTNPGRPLSTYEKAVIQKVIDKGYDTFLKRVAAGRSLDKAVIARVASGRVWSGQLAQEKGLVDELGGLEEAIQAAAKLAALKDQYTVSYWPKLPTWFEQVFSSLKNAVANRMVLRILEASFPDFKHIQALIDMTGIQARLPYMIE